MSSTALLALCVARIVLQFEPMRLVPASHDGESHYMAIVAQVNKKIELTLMGMATTENVLVSITSITE
jgi:hypothetical protein